MNFAQSVPFAKIAKRTLQHALKKDLGEKTAALTYSLILSLAPLIAIAFTLFKGFGGLQILLDETIKPLILTHFQSSVSSQLVSFLEDILKSLDTKALSVVGFVTFLTTVLFLLMNIEKSLNQVFEATEERKLVHKFVNYWVLISFSPVVIAFSSSKLSQVFEQFATNSSGISSNPVFSFLQNSVGTIFQFALFFLLYALVPNRKLKMRSLAAGATVALICFQGVAWLNVYLTKRAFLDGNMTSLYGTIPLMAVVFFMWIRLLWYVVLVGGCVALATSEVLGDFEESDDKKLGQWNIQGNPHMHRLIFECAETFAKAHNSFGVSAEGKANQKPLVMELLTSRGLFMRHPVEGIAGHSYVPLTHSAVLLSQPELFLKWLLQEDQKSFDDVSRGFGSGNSWAAAFADFCAQHSTWTMTIPKDFPEPNAFAQAVVKPLSIL
jgi:YihY family inner membrane protein